MRAYLEVWGPGGRSVVALGDERFAVGSHPDNDLAVASDRSVSRLHAVFERFPAGWCVRDLSSRNGTFVNGQRLFGQRPLRPGDDIRVGRTRLVYRTDPAGHAAATEPVQGPPELTRRERDVLLALCRPVLGGDLFTEPASLRQIAEALTVTEAAVKQHLLRLYDKFGLHQGTQRRRVRLANEAVRRGAVTLADLHGQGPP
ncbi:MAG TPA: FHA domain-containing protein [Egibacteraceae bacterium]|nr:FHA domain-containing protein [Egibacteraceae bacterium]